MDGEVTPDEVKALLDDDGDVRVVDIRSPGGYKQGHIPGSENVPLGRLPNEVDRFDDADRVVTVCPHGKASVQAARLIGSYEGADDATVESMAGGLESWADDHGFALETDDGSGSGDGDADAANAPF